MLRQAGWLVSLGVVVALLAGCGGGKKEEEGAAGKEAQAACTGSAMSETPNLPASFPQIEPDKLTLTSQTTQGPSTIIEGHFNGTLQETHDEFKRELQGAGFQILFDEVDEHDSEVTWKGEGRTGQVAIRDECGDSNKMFVHITNRPA